MLRLKVRKKALREIGKAFAVGFMAAAVLWLTAGFPVVSQSGLPTRDEIVNRLQAALGDVVLVAGQSEILDFDSAAFYSDVVIRSVSFVPFHPASPGLVENLSALLDGEDVSVAIGLLTLETNWPGMPEFEAGTYRIVLKPDRSLQAVDSDGKELTIGYWEPVILPVTLTEDDSFAYFAGFEYSTEITSTKGEFGEFTVACPWCAAVAAIGRLLVGIGTVLLGIAAVITAVKN